MSLLGVVSRTPVFAQMAGPSEGWGVVVHEASKRWAVSARGPGGVLAVREETGGWAVHTKGVSLSPTPSTVRGDSIIAVSIPHEESVRVARSAEWFFAYEGTIRDVDALCAALEPAWFVPGGYPKHPGNLIFAHVMNQVAGVDSTSVDAAMTKAAIDLRRARVLGSVAFLCSNGASVYAYAAGHRLLLANVADAILVGSTQILPARSTTQELLDGALVALASHPQLGWSMLVQPSPNGNHESFAMQQARRGFR